MTAAERLAARPDGISTAGSAERVLQPAGIRVEPLREELISQVEKIHVEAFAGYMNTRLGGSYLRAFFRWFLRAPGAVALVALDGDTAVQGYVVGAPIDYGPRMNRDLAGIAAISIAMRPWLLGDKHFWSIISARLRSYLGSSRPDDSPPLPRPALSLIGVGVARAARGKKIGAALLHAFEGRARELGMRSLQLTVYANNSVARSMYETSHWMQRPGAAENHDILEYVRILDDLEPHGTVVDRR
jgi:ribosomal protein S18 acetylase RimI-like enzyme